VRKNGFKTAHKRGVIMKPKEKCKDYPVEKFLKRLAKVFKVKPEVVYATFEIVKQELNNYFKENRPVKLNDAAFFDLGFGSIYFKKMICCNDQEGIVASATPPMSIVRSINEGLVDFTKPPPENPAKK
jgi:translation elongation factor EF-1beta